VLQAAVLPSVLHGFMWTLLVVSMQANHLRSQDVQKGDAVSIYMLPFE
jgi:hypothetical protein